MLRKENGKQMKHGFGVTRGIDATYTTADPLGIVKTLFHNINFNLTFLS
jgi:hypothetical protein